MAACCRHDPQHRAGGSRSADRKQSDEDRGCAGVGPSDDQKRSVLGREQTNELIETVAEYIQLVKENLDFKHEQQTTIAAKSDAVRRSANVLVLAGRGSLDLAASQLIAEAIRLELGIIARCPSLGGLTGIGAAAEAEPDAPPDVVALVSVGVVTPAQLDLLLRRVRRTFPRSQIIIGYWDEAREHAEGADTEGVRSAKSIASLIDLAGRTADRRPHAAESIRHLAAADA
jgi:hypothetical protein